MMEYHVKIYFQATGISGAEQKGRVKMKKLIILAILACVITAFAFAAENFTVQNVSGRVERESGGQRVEVKAGDTLGAETVIHTGVTATLTLKDGEGKSFTVNAARTGKVAELTKAAAGVRIGGNVAKTDTGTVSRTTAQVGTASARASDQAGEDNIALE